MKGDLATRLESIWSPSGLGLGTNRSLHIRLGKTEEEAQSGEQNTQQLAKDRTAKDKRSQLENGGGGASNKNKSFSINKSHQPDQTREKDTNYKYHP